MLNTAIARPPPTTLATVLRSAPLCLVLTSACSTLAGLGDGRSLEPDATIDDDGGVSGDAASEAADTAVDGMDQWLYFQDAEVTGGCAKEAPPLFPAGPAAIADCDDTAAPLAGSQSIRIEGEQSVLCDPCFSNREFELWSELLVRVDKADNYAFVPLQFVTDDIVADPLKRRTGAYVAIEQGNRLILTCTTGGMATSSPVNVTLGRTYLLTMHYVWSTGMALLWVRTVDSSGKPTSARAQPSTTLTCPAQLGATGWFAQGFEEPGSGVAHLDNIFFSRYETALRNP